MKKHLIAAAVAAAVAVPAAAQVTVYGMIGAEYQVTDNTGAADETVFNDTTNLGTPVIGLRGAEDLGGGLKAEFQLEGALTSDGSLGTTNSTTTYNQVFNRQAWVGISGAFGSVKFGRQNTATKDIEGVGDVGANLFDVGGDVDTLTDRFASTFRYETPTMNGFQVAVTSTNARDAKARTSSTAATVHANLSDGVEINAARATYTSGPLAASVGYAEGKSATGFSTENSLVGLIYKLPMAELQVAYQKEQVSATEDRTLTQIGAIVPVGGGLNIHVNWSDYDKSDTASTDVTYTGIIANYAMSKRTNLYAGYRNASFGTGATITDSAVTAFGINHKF